jgi:hypothetical protein
LSGWGSGGLGGRAEGRSGGVERGLH